MMSKNPLSKGVRAVTALGGLTVTSVALAPLSDGWKALGMFAGVALALPGTILLVRASAR